MGAAAVGGQARRGRCLFNDSNGSGCNGSQSKYLRQRRCLFNDRLAPNAREHALRCAGFEFLGYASARMKMANKRTRLLSGEARRLTQDRGLSGARRAADLAKAFGWGHVNAERSCSGSSRGTSSTSYTHISLRRLAKPARHRTPRRPKAHLEGHDAALASSMKPLPGPHAIAATRLRKSKRLRARPR